MLNGMCRTLGNSFWLRMNKDRTKVLKCRRSKAGNELNIKVGKKIQKVAEFSYLTE